MLADGTFKSYFGAVAVPVLDKGDGTISNVTHDWANAAAALGGGLAVTILRLEIRNKRVDLAKERLAELALANNAQFVFFLDDDVICPPDTLMKMIKLWKSDPKYNIISGVYWSKSEPAMPLVFKGNLEGSFWDWTTQDLIEADGAGAGCLFVNTDVFRKMSKPWFSCNYYYEDPRSKYDIDRWRYSDLLSNELIKGDKADPKAVEELERLLKETGNNIQNSLNGGFDPNLMKDKQSDGSTTEDLFFFRKAREELNEKLWIDCSIQCMHQDKRTGRMFGISPDMPQARARYEGQMKPGDAIVLDIGAGNVPYYVEEGFRIRVDNDPKTDPHILTDARTLPVEDCYADMVMSSHLLEHFSMKETVSVLKEWVRTLKVGGKLFLAVPNLKWASNLILHPEQIDCQETGDRVFSIYYSAQKGDIREANTDFHKAGFTPESMAGLLSRITGLNDIKVSTSDGNAGNWKEFEHTDGLGYNIIAVATKEFHDAPMSIKMPMKPQMEARSHIGEKAKDIDVEHAIKSFEEIKDEIKAKISGKSKNGVFVIKKKKERKRDTHGRFTSVSENLKVLSSEEVTVPAKRKPGRPKKVK